MRIEISEESSSKQEELVINAAHRRYSNTSSIPEDENPSSGYLSDYVKDVPIELFTVSKMVVTTHHKIEPPTELNN